MYKVEVCLVRNSARIHRKRLFVFHLQFGVVRQAIVVSKHLQPESDKAPGPLLGPGAKPFTSGSSLPHQYFCIKRSCDGI